MRAKDIVVGGVYITRVGGDLVNVRVVYQTTLRERPVFRVRRVGNGAVLPKCRAPAALHPVNAPKLTPEQAARDAKRREASRKASLRARLRRVQGHRDFAAQFHAAVSTREVCRAAHAYFVQVTEAFGAFDAHSDSARAWLREVMRQHLTNRAVWLQVDAGTPDGSGWEAAKRFERQGRGVTRQAASLAPMLGADPETMQALMGVRS